MERLRPNGLRLWWSREGASAIEFALVAPIFLALLFGIVGFGLQLALVHGVQQIAAESARASLAGLTDPERATIAQDSVVLNAPFYPFITPARLQVVSAVTNPATGTFLLTLRYDASDLFIYSLPFVPPSSSTIIRSAAIQRGGY